MPHFMFLGGGNRICYNFYTFPSTSITSSSLQLVIQGPSLLTIRLCQTMGRFLILARCRRWPRSNQRAKRSFERLSLILFGIDPEALGGILSNKTGIDGNEKEVIGTSRGLLHHNKQEFDGNIWIQKAWHCGLDEEV